MKGGGERGGTLGYSLSKDGRKSSVDGNATSPEQKQGKEWAGSDLMTGRRGGREPAISIGNFAAERGEGGTLGGVKRILIQISKGGLDWLKAREISTLSNHRFMSSQATVIAKRPDRRGATTRKGRAVEFRGPAKSSGPPAQGREGGTTRPKERSEERKGGQVPQWNRNFV